MPEVPSSASVTLGRQLRQARVAVVVVEVERPARYRRKAAVVAAVGQAAARTRRLQAKAVVVRRLEARAAVVLILQAAQVDLLHLGLQGPMGPACLLVGLRSSRSLLLARSMAAGLLHSSGHRGPMVEPSPPASWPLPGR